MRLRELLGRLRDRWRRDELSAELDEELRHHRALLERDHQYDRTLGNTTYYKEEVRAMWSLGILDDLVHDLRYALRVLRRDAGFTLGVVVTLALGIGANTAVFSIVNAVLLRPLPYRQPDRLVAVWTSTASQPTDRNPVSLPDLRDWQQQATMLDGIAGYGFNRFDITGPEGDTQARAILGTGNLYDVLGASPLLGRLPRADEEDAPVVAISYRLWSERFGRSPDVIGKRMIMNQMPYTIIGVMPPGLHFPTPDIDLFTTLYSIISSGSNDGSNPWITSRSFRAYRVVARLHSGETAGEAEVALNGIQRRLGELYPGSDNGIAVHVESVRAASVKGVARGLWTVFGAAGLILLLACVNVAHLLLERMTARTRELAVRRALGAHRGRVLRQLATESIVLGLAGGAAGVAFAFGAMRMLLAFAPSDIPRLENVAIDLPTLAFAVIISLVAALLFGMAPAFFGGQGDVHATLRAQGKASEGAHGIRMRSLLTALEAAFAVVLLVGAGLMLRSFRALTTTDLGVDATDVAVAQLVTVGAKYRPNDAKVAAVDQVLANVRAIPGVKAAGASTSMSPNRIQEIESYGIIGEPAPAPGHEPTAIYIPMTPGFVEALGIPLLSGRAFDARDGANAPHVAVISRELARRHFPHVNPIGHELSASGDTVTIVGVVGDVVYEGLGTPVKPVIYVPFAQVPFPGLWLAIRTTTPAAALAGPLREAYHRVDPELATRAPVALETMVGESLVRPRFNAWLLSTFGALALILASIGIYSVIAYGVTQRRAELGIRLALGAPRSSVISTVLRGGLTPVIVGLAIGVVTAALASRVIAGLLYGISPTDAVTLAGSAAVLFATALLAAFIPAHRAARVDPLSVIRGD